MDSHALLWWLEGDARLSRRARKVIDGCSTPGGLLVSPVTLWEFRRKELLGQLPVITSVDQWPALLAPLDTFRFVPTDPLIWLTTAELEWKHRDPADRIIAATAIRHHVRVLTKDKAFHRKASPVEAVW